MFNKIRTSSAWSSPRKTYGRSQQYPTKPPKLRPERQRRKGSPPRWNPQMSVRQGTRFNLSLGAFSQSSAKRETEDSGGVRCAVRAEPIHSLSHRGQSAVSYRCSRIKHTCFLLSKLKSDPDMDRNWEFSFAPRPRWNSLPVSVTIIYHFISQLQTCRRFGEKKEAILVIKNRNMWSR